MGLGYMAAVIASSITALTVTPAFVCDFTAFRSLARKRPWVARFLSTSSLLTFSLRFWNYLEPCHRWFGGGKW